jgi:cytoskeletal protein RodZ
MTDHDRGAYTPQTDAPLSFDARRAPRGGGGRPLPMTLMISGLVLVVLLVGVVYFYRSGVRQANEAPQVVGAPVASDKAPPPASAQPSDPAAGLQVYKSEGVPPSQPQSGTAPKFMPAPEQPAPRPAPRETPPPAPVQSAAPPAVSTTTPAAPVAAAVKPAPKIAATPKPLVTPKPAATTAAATTVSPGGSLVQIGAFSSAALADKGWNDVAQVLPGAMTGKTKTVQVIQKDGVTYYRTSVGGFASRDAAASFCASLRAAGKSCIVK